MKITACWPTLTFLLLWMNGWTQTIKSDSSELLEEVVIRAFESNQKLINVPAAVSYINKTDLNRFNNLSLLPAINTSPGVRMEERSPGSYRLNIRGSSLRSPFGVRNVKVYYNNIPYTDPGGNTFFNQLGFYNVGSMEIIKGPGSSLYGAGTGGAILLSSEDKTFTRGASLQYVNGSFNSNSFNANLRGGTEDLHHSMNYQYQNSDGYRDHTKLERKVISWDGFAKVGKKGTLRAHFIQGDLFYETPGALTSNEYNINAKAARPRAGQTPGAEEAHASVNQKIYMAGLSYTLVWDEHFQNITSMYGAYSRLINPTTRNYERRTEPHFGSRNVIQYKQKFKNLTLTWHGGLEIQQGFAASKVYTNVEGAAGLMTSDDEVTNKQYSLFTQGMVELNKGWFVTAGVSLNILNVELQRFSQPASTQEKQYNNEFAPRVALLKKLNESVSAYGSVSKGFSPPTNAELLPSTGVISTNLEAEQGVNMEAGIKGRLFKKKLYFDVNTFYFRLTNTIAQRRDEAGADYFVNAGSTKQLGLESYASYHFRDHSPLFLNSIKIWVSHTWHNFHYNEFQRVTEDTADFSGNRLPSIPPHFVSAGLDITTRPGLYGNLTYYYSDPVALNDANSEYASSYNLLGGRVGYRRSIRKDLYVDLFAVADNIFDVKYSLGNDINAFGGRFYNVAPGQNFSAGIQVRYIW